MIQLSLVVPIYNDGYLGDVFCREIQSIFQNEEWGPDLSQRLEVLFVNDGSKNNSLELLLQTKNTFNFVSVISLSRNFGQQAALSCGYLNARGQLVGVLDVDMQDHPRYLPAMLKKMEIEEADICQGVRVIRSDGFLKNLSSHIFKKLIYGSIGMDVPVNHSTLRIFSRKAIESFRQFPERNRFVPGIELLLGYKRCYIDVEHGKGEKETSSYNFRKRLRLALDAMISFSELPMKLVIFLSLCMFILGFLWSAIIIAKQFFVSDYLVGWTSLFSALLIGFGLMGLFIGIIGLYISRILNEVKQRPSFIIDKHFLN